MFAGLSVITVEVMWIASILLQNLLRLFVGFEARAVQLAAPALEPFSKRMAPSEKGALSP
jgi:hypothetical protein